jgi:hypothetical protein
MMSVYLCMLVHIHSFVHIYSMDSIFSCMYIVYVCVYVCMYVCMYVCIYICIHRTNFMQFFFLTQDCESESKLNYIRGSNADIKLKPMCPNPITVMRATDDPTSWQSFNLAGDQRYLTLCMYVCMYVCIYVYLHVLIYLSFYVCMYVCMKPIFLLIYFLKL